jgi:hypothetical protein
MVQNEIPHDLHASWYSGGRKLGIGIDETDPIMSMTEGIVLDESRSISIEDLRKIGFAGFLAKILRLHKTSLVRLVQILVFYK